MLFRFHLSVNLSYEVFFEISLKSDEAQADPNEVGVLNCFSAEDGPVEWVNQPHCKDNRERKEREKLAIVLFRKVVQEHTAWRRVYICSEDQKKDDENIRVRVVAQAFRLEFSRVLAAVVFSSLLCTSFDRKQLYQRLLRKPLV